MNRNHLDVKDVHVWSFDFQKHGEFAESTILSQYRIDDHSDFSVFFSVAKTKKFGAVAVSRQPVGVYVEQVNLSNSSSSRWQGLSAEQIRVVNAIQDSRMQVYFLYKIFCFREALLKGLEIAGSDEELVEKLCIRNPQHTSIQVEDWAVFQFDFKHDHAAAFSTQIVKPNLKLFQYLV